ncbi:MAG: leucine-rich repeat domain-containing protein [Clostridia bacterium]|nr:leucine-rich repeat domain-containing protein [Clostridia bacterium]
MKKILAILLSLMFMLSLASCGDDENEKDGKGTGSESTEEVHTVPEEPDVPVAEDFAWELVDVAVDFQTNASSPKILVVSGHGRMPDFNEDENNYLSRPWEEDADNIVYVYVRDGIVSVSDHAFMLCRNLRAVTFENKEAKNGKMTSDVAYVGDCAFYGCYKLGYIDVRGEKTAVGEDGKTGPAPITAEDMPNSELIDGNVALPSGVTSVGDYAFRACTSMKQLTLPESIGYIGEYAFRGCTSLEGVIMKSALRSISEGTFYDCTALKAIAKESPKSADIPLPETVNLPDSVTKIGDSAFFGCTSVTSVVLPSSVTSVGDYAFCKMTSVTSINLPSKVKTLGKGAFFGCTSLTGISLPASITSVGNNIIRECPAVQSIKFAGTKSAWSSVSKAESGVALVKVNCSDGTIEWKETPKETETVTESQPTEG